MEGLEEVEGEEKVFAVEMENVKEGTAGEEEWRNLPTCLARLSIREDN